MITFAQVSKTYGTSTALCDVSCVFNPGEFIGIIGPNGSGKSTLARVINGLIRPTSGTVSVDGIPVITENLFEIRQKVGMVFQNPDNQIVASTVIDDVAFGLENHMLPSSEIQQRAEDALAFVEMSAYAGHLTATLSGGQKQRIAIAGVMAMETPYIVLDEPTSLLDADGRTAVLQFIHKMRAQNRTVILISHFLEEVFIADKVLVLDEGRKVFFDTPHELLKNDDVLKRIGFPLPLHHSIAKKCKLYPTPLDRHTIMQLYAERYVNH